MARPIDGDAARVVPAYVVGSTSSADFPTSAGAFQPVLPASGRFGFSAFVTKLAPDGSALVYSTYLGGEHDSYVSGVTVDGQGHAIVTGDSIEGFPTTPGALKLCQGVDAFVTKLAVDGSSLVYSTCLGGSGDDSGIAIAVDSAGRISLVGSTGSNDFPTVRALQPAPRGGTDIFIATLDSGCLQGCVAHNLAITRIIAPKVVTLTARSPAVKRRFTVEIENRGPEAETIPDLPALARLVTLEVQSLGSCPSPVPMLVQGPPQRTLPAALPPRARMHAFFDVVFDCANDPARTKKSAPHDDYRVHAVANYEALTGQPDNDPDDDMCPRGAAPPSALALFADGNIKEKGCGRRKPDGTLGAPIFVDVIRR